jgi:membrane associated rhomboid family serine protease/Flp pilus assembly protein TadD
MDPSPPPASIESPEPSAPPPQRGVTIAELLAHITPRAWVTPTIAALIVVGFAVEVHLGASPTSPTGAELFAAGGDFGPAVAEGEWWRAVSSMFLHAGLLHIGFNMWAFWNIGKFAERVFGNIPYLFIYLLSGLGGSLASLATHPMTIGVGASGAIFGVYGAMLAFVLLHKGVFPQEYLARQRNSLLTFIGYNVVFSLSQKNIDMAAHAGGLVTGMAAGALMSRDLIQPAKHVARRVLAASGLTAAILLAGVGVERRLAALPVVEADRAANAALVHLKADQLPEAIDLYTQAILLEHNAAWISNRGLAYMMKDEHALALKDFREAHFLEPTPRTRALLCEVGVRIEGGDAEHTAALKYCSDAIALDPKNAKLFAFRASAYDDHGQLDEALADADSALQLDASNDLARIVRLEVRLKHKEAEEAEADCLTLLENKESSAFVLRSCARVARLRKDTATERVRLDRCLAVAPKDPDALLLRGVLNEDEGRWTDSLADYKALVVVAPKADIGWNNLAWVEVLTGDFAAARSDADQALALAPDQGSHYGTRCFALVGLGLERDARADCARAVELTPDSSTDRGMVAFIDRRFATARREWQEASQDPVRAGELKPWLAKVP